jgi:hypothetical protein
VKPRPERTLEQALESLRRSYEHHLALGWDVDISARDTKIILDHFGIEYRTREELDNVRPRWQISDVIAKPKGK